MNEFLSHERKKRRRKKNEKETNVRKSFFERQTWWYVNSYVLPPFRLDVLPPLSSRYRTFLAKSRVFLFLYLLIKLAPLRSNRWTMENSENIYATVNH